MRVVVDLWDMPWLTLKKNAAPSEAAFFDVSLMPDVPASPSVRLLQIAHAEH
jgi:hypothetical protein